MSVSGASSGSGDQVSGRVSCSRDCPERAIWQLRGAPLPTQFSSHMSLGCGTVDNRTTGPTGLVSPLAWEMDWEPPDLESFGQAEGGRWLEGELFLGLPRALSGSRLSSSPVGPRRGGPCSGSAGPSLVTWPVPAPVFPDGQHTLGSGLQGSGSRLQKGTRESLWEPQVPGGSPGVEPSGHGSQSPCPDLRLGGRRRQARWRWAEVQASGSHSPSQPFRQRKRLRSCQIPTCLLCGPDPPRAHRA